MDIALGLPAVFAWPVIAAEEIAFAEGKWMLPAAAFAAMYYFHQNDLNIFLRNYLGIGTGYIVLSRSMFQQELKAQKTRIEKGIIVGSVVAKDPSIGINWVNKNL